MKYYIIAGEASGDLHGANLMKALKEKDSEAVFRFWGGDLMQNQGGTLVKHYRDLAFMGFAEVVANLGTILKNIKFCKQDILYFKPDVLILIDYPGFNMRIATFAKKMGIKVVYYISPQIWAWKTGRVHKIKRDVDKMLVILPFEEEFYAKYDFQVDFVGHPLLDQILQLPDLEEDKFREKYNLSDKPIIALLPGSRKQEIKIKLPLMLSVVDDFPDYQFVVAGAPAQDPLFYKEIGGDKIEVVENETYNLLRISHAALVTSGTATLETALLEVPEVVCYKGSRISYEIGKRLIKHIQYISLVNLIMDKEVVKELIQNDLNYINLKSELTKILSGKQREEILENYKLLKEKLGGVGASSRAAERIVAFIK